MENNTFKWRSYWLIKKDANSDLRCIIEDCYIEYITGESSVDEYLGQKKNSPHLLLIWIGVDSYSSLPTLL